MHFELVTVVPEAVEGYLAASILGRAATSGAVSFGVTGLRDYGEGKHRVVDDAPYGGGPGMVMKPGPLVEAILQEQQPMRERALQFEESPDLVRNIIAEGCDKARTQAKETLEEVRSAMGLDYRML